MKREMLARVVRQQIIYICLTGVLCLVLWALGIRTSPLVVLLYTLCIGNLTSIAAPRFEPLYEKRAFPYDLLVFLPILAVVTIPVYLLTTVIVWLVALHAELTLVQLLSAWRFPAVVIFTFGIFFF